MLYVYHNDALTVQPSGFNNTGAICWFNSLLQSMLSCTTLSHAVLYNDNRQNEFASEYKELLLNNIMRPEHHSARLLIAIGRHMRAEGIDSSLGNSQECAHEGLIYTLDAIGAPAEVFHNEYERIMKCPNCEHTVPIRDKSYYILVDGSDFNTSGTNGSSNNTSNTSNDPTAITKYIHRHHELVTEYICEKCRSQNNINRSEVLRQLRECIILVFNKFHSKKYIWFPKTLEFDALPRGTKIIYEQMAQIEHIGGMSGGHYYAIVRRGNQWFNANDNSISPVIQSPTENTFMVFYNITRSV